MTLTSLIILLTGFQIKHFVADFLIQTEFQWKNKGRYGHVGGILHSGIHSLLSFFLLAFATTVSLGMIGIVVIIEFLMHYHIDYAKVNIEAKSKLNVSDSKFWNLFGFDQLLHQLTYVMMILVVILLKMS